jgi:hypothetical protein
MTFSIQEDYLGSLRTINLVPNGQNEAVTNENKLEYIMYYADYLLNKKVAGCVGKDAGIKYSNYYEPLSCGVSQ